MRVIALFAVAFLVVLLGVQFSGRLREEELRAAQARAAVERDSLRRWFVAESTRSALERDSIRTRAAQAAEARRARMDSVQRQVDCGMMLVNGMKSMAC